MSLKDFLKAAEQKVQSKSVDKRQQEERALVELNDAAAQLQLLRNDLPNNWQIEVDTHNPNVRNELSYQWTLTTPITRMPINFALFFSRAQNCLMIRSPSNSYKDDQQKFQSSKDWLEFVIKNEVDNITK